MCTAAGISLVVLPPHHSPTLRTCSTGRSLFRVQSANVNYSALGQLKCFLLQDDYPWMKSARLRNKCCVVQDGDKSSVEITSNEAQHSESGDSKRTRVKKPPSTRKKSLSKQEVKPINPPEPAVEEAENEEEEYDWPPLVCCFGEALHEFLPSVRVSEEQMDPDIYSSWKGLQWSPPEFARLPGSVPSNVAIALARLGGRVAFIGKVGDDDFGHELVLKLNTEGVQTRGVRFDPSLPTAVSRLRLLHEPGSLRMSTVQQSAESSLLRTEINEDILKEARMFQFTSMSLTAESSSSALMTAIKLAQKNGADIFYDVNIPLPFWRSVELTRKSIQNVWKESTIVEVTKQEVEFILGEEYFELKQKRQSSYYSTSVEELKNRRYHYHYEPEEISPLWHSKMKLILVTDGTYRIHYYTEYFHGSVAGTEDVLVTPFTCDRTGSGDVVVAAIIRKLTTQPEILQDEIKLQKALRFCICAGIIGQWTIGATLGMPTESAAQNLTEQVYPPAMVL